MLDKLLKELKDNIDYFDYHNKNLTKEQEFKINDIKDIIGKLENIHLYYEVARAEVVNAIETLFDDEEYTDYQDKLENITEDTINTIAWKVEDSNVWEDVYNNAYDEVLEELGVGIDE